MAIQSFCDQMPLEQRPEGGKKRTEAMRQECAWGVWATSKETTMAGWSGWSFIKYVSFGIDKIHISEEVYQTINAFELFLY